MNESTETAKRDALAGRLEALVSRVMVDGCPAYAINMGSYLVLQREYPVRATDNPMAGHETTIVKLCETVTATARALRDAERRLNRRETTEGERR